jgi:sugar lactone lactonase YvrE
MPERRTSIVAPLILACFIGISCSGDAPPESGEVLSASAAGPSEFVPDEFWPADIPEHWVFGPGTGLYVDGRDHAWILHRPERITEEDMAAAVAARDVPDCCEAAPPLIELDPFGRMVGTYGSIEPVEDWPYFPHGVFVDHNDFVWVGNAPHHTIMKFTRHGEHLLTIGAFDQTAGSFDEELLGGAADYWVDPGTNELLVADGYDNRRVVVFDAETGAYLRQWGAYGNEPDDSFEHDPSVPLPEQFNLVHGLTGSRDGLLYVADATSSRIQVFQLDGTFVAETTIDGRSLPARITDVALSPDPEQTWLYVADGRDDKIWTLRRSDLAIMGSYGESGAGWGQFGRPHNVATDSQGNLYIAEAHPGRRFQKLIRQAPSGSR